jgi:hypothetical protein
LHLVQDLTQVEECPLPGGKSIATRSRERLTPFGESAFFR